jgi:hypothetical protein
LSFNGGYAYFSDWIAQDISLGWLNGTTNTIDRSLVNYTGQDHVVSFSAHYAITPRLRFNAGFEWNSGTNVWTAPTSTTGADWSALPSYSNVIAETWRYNAGFDFLWRKSFNWFLRYNYFEYDDKTVNSNSGTLQTLLAGASAKY